MSGLENEPLDSTRAMCRQFDLNLPAYLEGEDKPEVMAHARECPSCGTLLADLEQIRFTSRHLPSEEPPPRLWANVRATLAEEGIIQEQVPAWQRWIPQLAFLHSPQPIGALAGLAVLALALLGSPRGYETPTASDILPGAEAVTVAGIFSPELNGDLTRTVQEMEEAYQAHESSLEPGLKDTYKKSLETLNATIQECIRHCRREPGNALARQFLVRAYQSKAEVLASALEYNNR